MILCNCVINFVKVGELYKRTKNVEAGKTFKAAYYWPGSYIHSNVNRYVWRAAVVENEGGRDRQ